MIVDEPLGCSVGGDWSYFSGFSTVTYIWDIHMGHSFVHERTSINEPTEIRRFFRLHNN